MATSSSRESSQFITLCGRIFRDTDPSYFPRAQYGGRTIYLCTESCLGAFLADPDIFYKVHRNSQSAAKLGKPVPWISSEKTIGKD
jgi:YHS domain-containing protein